MMATILPLLATATAAAADDDDGARRPDVAIVAATVNAEEGGPPRRRGHIPPSHRGSAREPHKVVPAKSEGPSLLVRLVRAKENSHDIRHEPLDHKHEAPPTTSRGRRQQKE